MSDNGARGVLRTPATATHNQPLRRMAFSKTTPILRMLDEAAARAFYVGYLGFHIDWEHRFEAGFPLYMQVSRDGCLLHLSGHTGDCQPGAALRIEADNLDVFRQQLVAVGGPFTPPAIQDMPWGSRDLSVIDPFGNRLTFTNAISV